MEIVSVTVMEWLAPESAVRDAAAIAGGRVVRATNGIGLPINGWEAIFEYQTKAMVRVAVRTFYKEARKSGWRHKDAADWVSVV